MFERSLKCRLASCSSVYQKSEYIYLQCCGGFARTEVVGVISGVCWLAFGAVNLGISSPTVVKVLELCFICPTVVNCLLTWQRKAQQSQSFSKLPSGVFVTGMCLSVLKQPSKMTVFRTGKKLWPWEEKGVCMRWLSPVLGH